MSQAALRSIEDLSRKLAIMRWAGPNYGEYVEEVLARITPRTPMLSPCRHCPKSCKVFKAPHLISFQCFEQSPLQKK